MKRIGVGLIAMLTLTACGGVPVKTVDASNAVFAPPPTQEGAERWIRTYLEKILTDPESLRLKCSPVQKGWGRNNRYDSPEFGWLVVCDVNSKNQFGGYAGAKPFGFVINGSNVLVIDNPYFPGSPEGTYVGRTK